MQETKEKLSEKKCKACKGTEKTLGETEIFNYLNDIDGWALTNEDTLLFRKYTMNNFMDAVAFIQQIASIAETDGHHPDLHLTNYKKLRIELSTHAIGGLSENDFIMAAKINEIPSHRQNIIDAIKKKGAEIMSNIPNREEYIKIVQAQTEKWQAKIHELQAKAKEVEAKSKIEYDNQIKALQNKVDESKKKLNEIKQTSNEVWKTIAEGTGKAWNELKTSMEEAFKKIKNEKA